LAKEAFSQVSSSMDFYSLRRGGEKELGLFSTDFLFLRRRGEKEN
jgi:hypothetical protein